ncbi:MAG: aspartyl/asparaginyl beta-hydroxylase domain-containing protein [Nitrospirae bacterium]|nr:aspartyl/asparaginyl beta-hydroxylase domain-containing protein [Nitrospirota bacterium]
MLTSDRGQFPVMFSLLHAAERLFANFSVHGDPVFYERDRFPWTQQLERGWEAMREECERVMQRRELIPNFQDISPEQSAITRDDKWKTYVLYAYGVKARHNCAACPNTTAVIEQIPGMKTALFSILSGPKHIPLHRGPYKGLLRCHVGLLIPGQPGACRIRVAGTERHWQEGGVLIFDDTFPHEVWNDTTEDRIVLFLDIVRPMRFPLSVLNDWILRLIVHSPYGRSTIRRFARWYELRGIKADV